MFKQSKLDQMPSIYPILALTVLLLVQSGVGIGDVRYFLSLRAQNVGELDFRVIFYVSLES
jgi:hypothetical protein